ncbi:MAG: hypothetical protein JSS08_07755 [Proteobacteria bacterium]|nr:hypothetical protein [Pseudomonadota bacterium]
MTDQDDQLVAAVKAMDKAAKHALLEILRRVKCGEISPQEAVAEFGRYAAARSGRTIGRLM